MDIPKAKFKPKTVENKPMFCSYIANIPANQEAKLIGKIINSPCCVTLKIQNTKNWLLQRFSYYFADINCARLLTADISKWYWPADSSRTAAMHEQHNIGKMLANDMLFPMFNQHLKNGSLPIGIKKYGCTYENFAT